MYKVHNKYLVFLVVFLPFFIAGLVFVVLGLGISFNGWIKKYSLDSVVEASHIESRKSDSENGEFYSPVYTYEVDGETYICSSSTTSENFSRSYLKVYYDSKNPSDCLTDYTVNSSYFGLFFALFGLPFCLIGLFGILVWLNGYLRLRQLSKNGILYKGLKYDMVPSNVSVNGEVLLCPQIEYQSSDGVVHILSGGPGFPDIKEDYDGCVDLLIDPNDSSNYYIDFEIKRKF